MEYLVTADEMRAYDTYTIEKIGISASVLMERAALKTVERILYWLEEIRQKRHSHATENIRILCVCGTGNNGGDGLCVARLLMDRGLEVEAALIGDRSRVSEETLKQLAILSMYGFTVCESVPEGEFAIVVDALFGTGLSREVTGVYRQAVEAINEKQSICISIDMPSGIHSDTGAVLGAAVQARETVTLAFKKRGLYLYPGTRYAGRIYTAGIGITQRSFQGRPPGMYTLSGPASQVFPKRRPDGNKGTFGKLLLIAGSREMAGAAILSAYSAYRGGAGMVKLVIPEKIKESIHIRLPEALVQTYENPNKLSKEEEKQFLENMEWADAAAIGPGLTVCETGRRLAKLLLHREDKPLVMDADALNLLAQNAELEALLKKRAGNGKKVILTPHMGELARLLKKTTAEVTANETKSVQEAAEAFGCVVVGKSARTHVCEAGTAVFLNTAGNDKMATAGSGDVLTGIIAAFTAQGMEERKAAEAGVYVHACCGDAAAKEAGARGLLASDIAKACHRP